MPDGQLSAYTLEDCLLLGLERSIPLQNSTRDQVIADEYIREVRSQVFPSARIGSAYTRLDEAPVVEDREGSEDSYQAAASVSQLLYSGGSVSAALRAAEAYRRYADFGTQQTANRIMRDITLAYYDLLYAESAHSVACDSLAQLIEFERQTRLKFEAETASEFEWLSAQVKVANERPRVIIAKNTMDLARESLKNLLYEDTTNFVIRGELTIEPIEANLDDLLALALEQRPEMGIMSNRIAMREQDVIATRGDYFPKLHARAAYQGNNPGNESPADDEWKWHWNAGLTLEWSIMDGGLRRGKVAQKRLELEKTRAENEDLRRSILMEVRNAFLQLNHAREAAHGAEYNVTLAQKALDIALVRYQQGLFTYLEYTDSNLSLTQAKLIYYQSIQAYEKALAQLRYACGSKELSRAK